MQTDDRQTPPRAEQRPVAKQIHGMTRIDEFDWLRADNWQEVIRDPQQLAADIRAYLEAENAYTAAVMRDSEPLQEQLFAEMRGRIAEDDASVPEPDGPWEYFSAFRTGGQYPRFVRRARGAGENDDRIYFDGDMEAAGTSYFRLGGISHAHDHARFAYAVDTLGSELFEIRIREFDGTVRYAETLSVATRGS